MKASTPYAFVVRLSAIGDTLIATRAIAQLLREGVEPIFCTYEENAAVATLIQGLRFFCFVSKTGSLAFFARESEENAALRPLPAETLRALLAEAPQALMLDLQCTARSKRCIHSLTRLFKQRFPLFSVQKRSLYRIWLLARARMSIDQHRRVPLHTSFVYTPPASLVRIQDLQKEIVESAIKSLQRAGILSTKTHACITAAQETPKSILLPPEALGTTSPLPDGLSYVTLFPGASAPLKAWSTENFGALIDLILKNTPHAVVICGGKDEAAKAALLEKRAENEPERMYNLAGKTSLAETVAVIQKARHVVTGDSFAGHAADLYGVSATVIFGATSPLFGFVPLAPSSHVLYLDLSCSPCTRHGKGKCRFANMKCLQDIEPQQVFQELKQFL